MIILYIIFSGAQAPSTSFKRERDYYNVPAQMPELISNPIYETRESVTEAEVNLWDSADPH